MRASPICQSTGICWSCKSKTIKVFELNDFPFTGRFPKSGEESLTGDLTFSFCENCKLIQLEQGYSPDLMYSEYYYCSSINNSMRLHLFNLVNEVINIYGTKPAGDWLDIGCNDGFTLSIAKSIGWGIHGVDPSNIIGKYYNSVFNQNKINPILFTNDIFPPGKNKNLENKTFEIITTISMFYDVFNLDKFISQIDKNLKEDGMWVVEMNYTKDMIQNNGYDMIGHEHITYYTLESFINLLEKSNYHLKVFNCTTSKINGGSIRIYIDRGKRKRSENVLNILNIEKELKLDKIDTIKNFYKQIIKHAEKVNKFVNNLREEGKRISIYGASTRGNTNLLLSKLERDKIDFAYEKNSDKIGRYCPGTDILIKNENDLLKDMPDYLIVMPYSFIEEFLVKEKKYLENGGKMVTLVPDLKIYSI